MSLPSFKKGDFVTNPKVPTWGVGEVMEIRDESKLLVHFQSVGEKLMPSAFLCATTAPETSSLIPRVGQSGYSKGGKTRSRKNEEDYQFRNDPLDARDILSNLVSSRASLEVLLSQLLTSVGLANAIAPSAWAVSLFPHGFRLNVGRVETIYFLNEVFMINLIGTVGVLPFYGSRFQQQKYDSIYGDHCAYHGCLEDYSTLRERLAPAHAEFIRRASTTELGRPREGSTWAHSHSEGLIRYAQMVRDGQM